MRIKVDDGQGGRDRRRTRYGVDEVDKVDKVVVVNKESSLKSISGSGTESDLELCGLGESHQPRGHWGTMEP